MWHRRVTPYRYSGEAAQLPFLDKSADVCVLAHNLGYSSDPHRLLREADRVLIEDGWLIISGFNPLSLLGHAN